MSMQKLIAIEASGMVGALIYTFSDTFWFSAVEGEVYAYSSALTAIVFWLILKWEDHADEPHSDRWLVLITYITGLSIGVHLLNLLCVPAIVLVWYYRRHPDANLKGSLIALFVSFVLVAAILYGVVPGIITVGGWFELFFVNTLGMPFNTGLIIYIIALVAIVLWAIYETYQNKSVTRQNIAFMASVAMLGIPFYGYGWSAVLIGIIILVALWFVLQRKTGVKEKVQLVSARVKNTALLCMLMLMIGYSTYAVIVIRSAANPPMDQNSPEDIFTLGSYLSRDQYGDRPLFYGQAYTSQVAFDVEGRLYVGNFGDGEVSRVVFDAKGNVASLSTFAKSPFDITRDPAKPDFLKYATSCPMRTTDGMCFGPDGWLPEIRDVVSDAHDGRHVLRAGRLALRGGLLQQRDREGVARREESDVRPARRGW